MKPPALPATSWILPQLLDHGRAAYGCGDIIGPGRWMHHDLILVLRGELTLQCRREKFLCGQDSGVLVPPGWAFEGQPSPAGCTISVQHFTYPKRSTPPVRLPRDARQITGTMSPWMRTLIERISELQQAGSSQNPPTEAAVLFSLLLTALLEGPGASEDHDSEDDRRIHTLREELGRTPLPLPSITDLANRMGWCASHFRARFRTVSGESVGKYLQNLRMAEASKLLSETTLPIKEITSRLGYSDPVAFHRAFQQQTHQTPGQFRKASRAIA